MSSIFADYCKDHKGYRLHDSHQKRVFACQDVMFIEHKQGSNILIPHVTNCMTVLYIELTFNVLHDPIREKYTPLLPSHEHQTNTLRVQKPMLMKLRWILQILSGKQHLLGKMWSRVKHHAVQTKQLALSSDCRLIQPKSHTLSPRQPEGSGIRPRTDTNLQYMTKHNHHQTPINGRKWWMMSYDLCIKLAHGCNSTGCHKWKSLYPSRFIGSSEMRKEPSRSTKLSWLWLEWIKCTVLITLRCTPRLSS